VRHLGAQHALGLAHGDVVRVRLGRVDDGVLEEGAHEERLGVLAREAAIGQVVHLLGANGANGGAVVALDVVLVAENYGHGLVDHVVAKDQHVLGLVALGAAGAVDKVDGGAQGLLGSVVKDAVLAHVGDGVLAALAHHVVHVQVVLAVGEVAQPNVGAGAVAGEGDRRAKGHGAAAQRVLANLHAGVVVCVHAHALEVLLRGTNAHDLGDRDVCALLGNHAQERGRGGEPAAPVPPAATTMETVAPARTMTPVSATSPLSVSTATTMGSSRTVCAGTST
jgi:hypothetical protein